MLRPGAWQPEVSMASQIEVFVNKPIIVASGRRIGGDGES
jgi:hypothetical protein